MQLVAVALVKAAVMVGCSLDAPTVLAARSMGTVEIKRRRSVDSALLMKQRDAPLNSRSEMVSIFLITSRIESGPSLSDFSLLPCSGRGTLLLLGTSLVAQRSR